MKKLPHKRIIIVFRLDLKIFMSENPPAETLDQLYIDTKLGHTYLPVSLSDLINRPYLDVVDFVLGEFKACKSIRYAAKKKTAIYGRRDSTEDDRSQETRKVFNIGEGRSLRETIL